MTKCVKMVFAAFAAIFSLSSFSKDVRLPVQLQRAMAAEAEAAREARAKVKLDYNVCSLGHRSNLVESAII